MFVWDFDNTVTGRHQAFPGIVGAVANSVVEAVWLENHGGVKDDYKLALAMDFMLKDSELMGKTHDLARRSPASSYS